jgi:hypothetical protein
VGEIFLTPRWSGLRVRFDGLVKWRTGCEGRIAYLKRHSGWDRTMLNGLVKRRPRLVRGVRGGQFVGEQRQLEVCPYQGGRPRDIEKVQDATQPV